MESLFRPPSVGEVLEDLRREKTPWNHKAFSKHLGFLNAGIRDEVLHLAKRVERYKAKMGDDLAAAVIFGRTARFREGHRQPSDLDVFFLLRPGARLPPEERRLFVQEFAYPEYGEAFEARVKQATREGAFTRRMLLLPHVVLHGEDAMRRYRQLAFEHYRDSDFDELWTHRKTKVRGEIGRADPVEVNAELMAERALIEKLKADIAKEKARARPV